MRTIGIDLGTTNSLAAWWDGSEASLIPNALGEYLTPSVVGLDDDGRVLVGRAARERLQTHPKVTVANFKRYMGTDRKLMLGGDSYRPEELSSLVLKALKEDAEAYFGEPVAEAIISVPAYFSDAQRTATRNAGRLAGLTVERLINEPTAAAIAYGLHQRTDDVTFMVFDLGGGTFDVSVLELFDQVMQVHASSGDNFLGGEDFTAALVNDFLRHTKLGHKKLSADAAARISLSCELAKRALTERREARVSMHLRGQDFERSYRREDFERVVQPLLERLRAPVERALRDADMKASDLSAVVLVGGATRMPAVRSLVSKMMGMLPTSHLDPDHVVALGTGVQAGLKVRDAALEEVVLTDVAPYSLGTEVVHQRHAGYEPGYFHPIIERNCTVPVSRMDTLFTVEDYQREMLIHVYQGEARKVADNIRLGELHVPVPRAKKGRIAVDVRFTYDINGILEVEAGVQNSGDVKRVVIEGNPGMLTPREIEQCLKKLEHLKIHPRDQIENTTLLARGARLYEQSLGEMREYLSRVLSDFDAVLQRQDPKEISHAREVLEGILADIESESVL